MLTHFILLLASTTGCPETPALQPIPSTIHLASHSSAHATAQHLGLHQHGRADAHRASRGITLHEIHGNRRGSEGLESIA